MLDQADLAYIDYLRKNGAPEEEISKATTDALMEKGLTGRELETELAFQKYQQTGITPQSISPFGSQTLDTFTTALDYGSNLGRGAVAEAYQGATGENLGVDVDMIFRGDTPQSSELMRRAGVPEMDFAKSIAMQSGLPEAAAAQATRFVPSGRSMLGFAGDVAADLPSNAVPALRGTRVARFAGEALERLPKNFASVIKGIGTGATEGITLGMKKGGKTLYKSGLKDIDKAGNRLGKMGEFAPSEVLFRNGMPTGSAQTMSEEMQRVATALEKRVTQLVDEATAKGAKVDMNEAVRPAQEYINSLKAMGHPTAEMNAQIQGLQNHLDQYKKLGQQARPAVLDETPQLMELPVPQSQVPLDPSTRMLPDAFQPQPANVQRWYDAPTEGVSVDVSNVPAGQGPQVRAVSKLDEKNVYAPENPFPFMKTGAPEGEKDFVSIINNPIDRVRRNSLPVGGKYTPQRPANFEVGLAPRVDDFGNPIELSPPVPAAKQPTPSQVRQWKTHDQAAVGNWDTLADSPMTRRYRKKLAAGEQKGIEDASDLFNLRVDPKQGLVGDGELRRTNAELGALISKPVQKAARGAAEKQQTVNNFSAVDGMLAGAGLAGASSTAGMSMLPLVIKKGADISKTTGFRTRAGKALYKGGDVLPESFWRQLLLTPTDRDGIE